MSTSNQVSACTDDASRVVRARTGAPLFLSLNTRTRLPLPLLLFKKLFLEHSSLSSSRRGRRRSPSSPCSWRRCSRRSRACRRRCRPGRGAAAATPTVLSCANSLRSNSLRSNTSSSASSSSGVFSVPAAALHTAPVEVRPYGTPDPERCSSPECPWPPGDSKGRWREGALGQGASSHSRFSSALLASLYILSTLQVVIRHFILKLSLETSEEANEWTPLLRG
jgi:hypothetical protein